MLLIKTFYRLVYFFDCNLFISYLFSKCKCEISLFEISRTTTIIVCVDKDY